jgi:hypothetical protein
MSALVACACFAAAAGARPTVNPHCYGNRADRTGTTRWWADCADAWGPHAFTESQLRAALGKPKKVEWLSGTKFLDYGTCAFAFNRRHEATGGLCG